MSDNVQIKGGASEFEAAVIAVVLNQVALDHKRAAEGKGEASPGLSAWIRALAPQEDPSMPRDLPWPD